MYEFTYRYWINFKESFLYTHKPRHNCIKGIWHIRFIASLYACNDQQLCFVLCTIYIIKYKLMYLCVFVRENDHSK